MEQIKMNFEEESKPALSEDELEIQKIMDSDIRYKDNRKAAEQLQAARKNFKKSGKDVFEPFPPLDN